MIVDTFIFNKDFAALEIRLHELDRVVDHFIISESSFTHSGQPKPLYLSENLEALTGFEKKVTIVTDKRRHFTTNPRVREMIQRQNITAKIRSMKLSPKDIVFHSDCDEIPSAESISSLEPNCNVLFELSNYSNFLNLQNGTWARGRAIGMLNFKSIQHMRQDIFLNIAMKSRRHNIPILFISDFWTTRKFYLWKLPQFVKDPNITVLRNAGWHFNNLIPESQIIEKIESSCHTELATNEIKLQAVKNYRNGLEIYTGAPLDRVEIDDTYPVFVRENLSKYADFIYS